MGVSLSRFPKGPRGGTPAGQGLNVGPCRAQADGVTVIAGGWGCGGGRHRRLVLLGLDPASRSCLSAWALWTWGLRTSRPSGQL